MTVKKSKPSARTARLPVSKLAYSYRRYSSSQQRDGSSLERQLEMAQAICSEFGWTLIDLPPDAGISGFKITDGEEQKAANLHKGALGSFLKKVNDGQVPRGSVLIIEKMDRFSRNYVDLVLDVFGNLLRAGIEIYSCVDRTHYTLADIRGPKGAMLLQYAVMAMAMANDYSKSLGERIKSAVELRLAKCQQGLKMDLGSWNPRWIDFVGEHKQPGTFKENHNAHTIRRIVKEYLVGESMYSIAKGLIRDGVPTLAGGKWCQGTIGHILGNKTLLGDLELKGTIIKGYFPAAITQTQYTRLQAKLKENKERRGGSAHSDYIANLFRNRCKCAHCGGTITTIKVSRCSHHLYTCKTKRLGKCPSEWSLRVSAVEQDFFLNFLQQAPEGLLNQSTPEHADKVAEVQADIARYDREIKTLALLHQKVPIDELSAQLREKEELRQRAKAELVRLNSVVIAGQNAPKALMDIRAVFSRLRSYPVIKLERGPSGYFEGPDIDEVWEKHWEEVDEAVAKLGKYEKAITDTLKDNSVRNRLLQLLPSIVKGLVIDTTKKRYAVVFHNGKQSDWRSVAM